MPKALVQQTGQLLACVHGDRLLSPGINLFSPLFPSKAPEIVNYEPLGLEADMW